MLSKPSFFEGWLLIHTSDDDEMYIFYFEYNLIPSTSTFQNREYFLEDIFPSLIVMTVCSHAFKSQGVERWVYNRTFTHLMMNRPHLPFRSSPETHGASARSLPDPWAPGWFLGHGLGPLIRVNECTHHPPFLRTRTRWQCAETTTTKGTPLFFVRLWKISLMHDLQNTS